MIFNKTRVDVILIWGHGMRYFEDIISDIRSHDEFKILKIIKHKPKSIKKLVKEIYSYDYAPFWHLKGKVRYLLNNENEVCFIFIENKLPNEDYLGVGAFRHKESLTIKKFKEFLRDKYNPYENTVRSHNHIVHATDSQEQTIKILEYLGIENIVDKENTPLNLPSYLPRIKKYDFIQVDIKDLFSNIATGASWCDFSIETTALKNTPQFIGLSDNMEIYKKYISTFLGGPLTENYSLDRYDKLKDCFSYLEYPYEISFIVVKQVNKKLIILDGLHRACILSYQNKNKIKVCRIIE